MKTILNGFLALVCTGLLFSCGSDNSANSSEQTQKLEFEERKWAKTIGDCEKDACVEIDIRYRKIVDGPTEITSAVNRFFSEGVTESLNSTADDDVRAKNIDQGLDKFIESFERYSTQFPEAPGGWMFKAVGEPLFQGDSLISLSLEVTTYTGGAHPNTVTTLATLNRETGRQIDVGDVVTDVDHFTQLAEEKFRERFELSSNADLDEQGFFFEGGVFNLPENWCIIEDGILLHYNQYEAASYAEGAIELKVNWSELKVVS